MMIEMKKKRKKKKERRTERNKGRVFLSTPSSLFSLSLLSPSSLLSSSSPLRLVPARVAPPARLLELPPLAAHERLRRRARDTGRRAEVLARLASGRLAPEKNAVASGGRRQRQLVEGEHLASGGDDAGAGALGHAQGRHAQLGHLEQARVVGDGSDDGGRLGLLALHELRELGEGHRGAVGLGHVEAAEDDGVELGVGAAREELVELFFFRRKRRKSERSKERAIDFFRAR